MQPKEMEEVSSRQGMSNAMKSLHGQSRKYKKSDLERALIKISPTEEKGGCCLCHS